MQAASACCILWSVSLLHPIPQWEGIHWDRLLTDQLELLSDISKDMPPPPPLLETGESKKMEQQSAWKTLLSGSLSSLFRVWIARSKAHAATL